MCLVLASYLPLSASWLLWGEQSGSLMFFYHGFLSHTSPKPKNLIDHVPKALKPSVKINSYSCKRFLSWICHKDVTDTHFGQWNMKYEEPPDWLVIVTNCMYRRAQFSKLFHLSLLFPQEPPTIQFVDEHGNAEVLKQIIQNSQVIDWIRRWIEMNSAHSKLFLLMFLLMCYLEVKVFIQVYSTLPNSGMNKKM